MKTAKKNNLEKEEQIDRMIDDGLGAGQMIEEEDHKKIQPEALRKEEEEQETITNSHMVTNLDELKKLGNEMEQMETNSQLEEEGRLSDPIQKSNHDKK